MGVTSTTSYSPPGMAAVIALAQPSMISPSVGSGSQPMMIFSVHNAAARVKRVSFGRVSVAEFEVTLDDSKLPSDGLSPLGLGQFSRTQEFASFEEFESTRSSGVGSGVRHLDVSERRTALLGDAPDADALAALESVEEVNRRIRGQTVTTYDPDDEDESASAVGSGAAAHAGWASLRKRSAASDVVMYATAEEGARRDGLGGGFCELDEEEDSRRKARALSERAATEARKAEKRRCAGCRRYACIC